METIIYEPVSNYGVAKVRKLYVTLLAPITTLFSVSGYIRPYLELLGHQKWRSKMSTSLPSFF